MRSPINACHSSWRRRLCSPRGFGSETILGSSAEFAKHGLAGVARRTATRAALCLILVGLFFARRLYHYEPCEPRRILPAAVRQKCRNRRVADHGFPYLSWVAARFLALGIVLNRAGLDLRVSIIAMAALVTLYTTVGGMWAVSMTDAVQMVVIDGINRRTHS
ncbi:MAG: hypothetical protein U1F16_05320 [Turneriella sp.]